MFRVYTSYKQLKQVFENLQRVELLIYDYYRKDYHTTDRECTSWNCTMSFQEAGSMINNQVNVILRVTLIQYYRTHSLVLGLGHMQFIRRMCERGL